MTDLMPIEIDWSSMGLSEYTTQNSAHHYRVVCLLAHLAVTRGFSMLEPAANEAESWRKLAIKLGIKLVHDSDWDDFWRSVCLHIINNYGTEPRLREFAVKMKNSMLKKPIVKTWPRIEYLLSAIHNAGELIRFSQILTVIVSRAAADSDRLNVDRPTWFREFRTLRDVALEAVISAQGGKAKIGQSGQLPDELAVSMNNQTIQLAERSLDPETARMLALHLLDAANDLENQLASDP